MLGRDCCMVGLDMVYFGVDASNLQQMDGPAFGEDIAVWSGQKSQVLLMPALTTTSRLQSMPRGGDLGAALVSTFGGN